MQKSHSGCSVKYGATSQLAWNATSAVSKASVCPQQRHVYVGMVSGKGGSNCPPSVRRRSSLNYPGARGRVKAPLARLAADAALTRPASLPQDRQLLERRHHVAGEVSSGPGAAGIPLRGERFAAPGLFKWTVKKAPSSDATWASDSKSRGRFLVANAFQFA
jgi:hypothetical protein